MNVVMKMKKSDRYLMYTKLTEDLFTIPCNCLLRVPVSRLWAW